MHGVSPIADTGSDTVAWSPRRGKTNADFAGIFYNGKTKNSAAAAADPPPQQPAVRFHRIRNLETMHD
eukprot:COSAG05_NODE_1080_length_5950_cov_1.563323_1_plen_68_part_00